MTDLRRQLLDEGWEERFSATGRRLEEMSEYYRSLGYEVRIERWAAVSGDTCGVGCFDTPGADGPVAVLFTRPGSASPDQDELF